MVEETVLHHAVSRQEERMHHAVHSWHRTELCSTVPPMKPKGQNLQFPKPLQVRVAPEQHAQFVKAAQASGLTLSAWARTRLLQAAKKDLQSS